MARDRGSGVSGMSRCSIPTSASGSTTALTTVGETPIAAVRRTTGASRKWRQIKPSPIKEEGIHSQCIHRPMVSDDGRVVTAIERHDTSGTEEAGG